MIFDKYEMPIMKFVANMDDIKDYAARTLDILESWNPPIALRYVSNLTMSNFNAYMHSLKKFQHWPHSLLTMWGRCMTFLVVELEVPWHFKRVPTNFLQMETPTFDNETLIMNVVTNMDDLKYYVVGTSKILESWNPPIPSRYVSSITMSNFDAYMQSLKKFQCWPHSLVLTMRGRCMKFVVVELEVPWHFKRVPTNIL